MRASIWPPTLRIVPAVHSFHLRTGIPCLSATSTGSPCRFAFPAFCRQLSASASGAARSQTLASTTPRKLAVPLTCTCFLVLHGPPRMRPWRRAGAQVAQSTEHCSQPIGLPWLGTPLPCMGLLAAPTRRRTRRRIQFDLARRVPRRKGRRQNALRCGILHESESCGALCWRIGSDVKVDIGYGGSSLGPRGESSRGTRHIH